MKQVYSFTIALVFVVIAHYSVAAQIDLRINNELQAKISDLIGGRLVATDCRLDDYQFSVVDTAIGVAGNKCLLEFRYSVPRRKKFKSLDRAAVFRELEQFMRANLFDMIFQDDQYTLVTFKRSIGLEPDYAEFYLPDDIDLPIEAVVFYGYSDTETNIDTLVERYIDQELLASWSFDCGEQVLAPPENYQKQNFLRVHR